MTANRAMRRGLNGRQIRKTSRNPVNPVSITHMVEICCCGISSRNAAAETTRTLNTIVTAPGTALLITLRRKSPFTRSRFGSSASTNDGMPMVKTLVKVS